MFQSLKSDHFEKVEEENWKSSMGEGWREGMAEKRTRGLVNSTVFCFLLMLKRKQRPCHKQDAGIVRANHWKKVASVRSLINGNKKHI